MTVHEQKRVKQSNATTDRILNAAISLFGKKGYTNTTLKDVAEMVGVTHVLVLKYFESKENLLSEAYRYAAFSTYPPQQEELSLREKVEILIRQSVDVMNTKPEVFDFFMMLLCTSDLPEAYQTTRRELFDQMPIYQEMDTWQKQRALPDGDLYDYFMAFMRTVYTILDFHRKMSNLQGSQTIDSRVLLSHIVCAVESEMKTR